ncbi:MAG: hypothetical protein SFY69_05545 [Planctomycetota bacterium]|nr:hypothetical protein [Planctomycetota bacterium]
MIRALAMWSCVTLGVLGLVMWIASLSIVSYRRMSPGRGDLTVALQRGELWVTTGGTYFGPGFDTLHAYPRLHDLGRLHWWPNHGWYSDFRTADNRVRWWSVRGPIWIIVAGGLLPAGAMFPFWRRARRRRRFGLCPACGYDLAGVRDARCPECGRAGGAHVRSNVPAQEQTSGGRHPTISG